MALKLERLLKDWSHASTLLTSKTHFSESFLEEAITQETFYDKLCQVHDFKSAVSVEQAYGFEYAQLQHDYWIKAHHDGTHLRALHLFYVPQGTQRIVMKVAYDGTMFEGFQRQPKNARTVQGELESALSHLHPEEITLHPASRTDKGVHAEGQWIQFDTKHPHPVHHYLRVMPRLLPRDIHIREVIYVPSVFHVRYDVWLKTYHYRLSSSPSMARVHHVYHTKIPSLDVLNARLALFIGTHDFANFAKIKGAYTTVRTLTKAHAWMDQEEVVIEIQGKGFARYMIRMIVGAVLKDDETHLLKALQEPTKPIGKHLAPAHGLTLSEISYRQA